MKLTITIDESLDETVVEVRAPNMNSEVLAIQSLATRERGHRIVGNRGTDVALLELRSILAFSIRDKMLWASTREGDWLIKARLYEIEQLLPPRDFIKISQSEILNIAAIAKLDLSFSGTICAIMKDGSRYFVARRQLKNFKEKLGI